MAIDLSWLDLNLVGWVFVGLAAVVLALAILRLFGHLLHIILRGCGIVVLVAIVLYILHLLKLI